MFPLVVLEKNAKILLSLVEMAGIKTGKGDLNDEEATAQTLQRGLGNQFKMDLKVTPNKKNPSYPYRNYEFEPLETVSNSVPAINLTFLFTESTIQLLNTSAGSRNPSEYSSFKLIVLHLPLASKKPFLFSSAFLVLSLYKDAYDNKLGLIVHPLGK